MSDDERRSIERLYLDYVRVVDDGPLGEWPGLFTEDASYRIVARENLERGLPLAVMRCDSRDMLHDRVTAIEGTAFYVRRRVRHVVGLLDVRPLGEGWSVTANFAVFQSLPRSASTLLCAGSYDDVVVGDGTGWRFAQKHCIYDGDLVTESLVLPL